MNIECFSIELFFFYTCTHNYKNFRSNDSILNTFYFKLLKTVYLHQYIGISYICCKSSGVFYKTFRQKFATNTQEPVCHTGLFVKWWSRLRDYPTLKIRTTNRRESRFHRWTLVQLHSVTDKTIWPPRTDEESELPLKDVKIQGHSLSQTLKNSEFKSLTPKM